MAVCILLSVVGCVQADIEVSIRSDDTACLSATILIDEATYAQLRSLDTSELSLNLEEFVKDSEVDGYYLYTKTEEFESYEQLAEELQELKTLQYLYSFLNF